MHKRIKIYQREMRFNSFQIIWETIRIFNFVNVITLYFKHKYNTIPNNLNDTQLEHYGALLLPSKSVYRVKEITPSLRPAEPKI